MRRRLGQIAEKSVWAYPLVYVIGVLSSTGPCAAPRVLAFSSFMLRSLHPRRTSVAFLGGTLCMYAALGYVGRLCRKSSRDRVLGVTARSPPQPSSAGCGRSSVRRGVVTKRPSCRKSGDALGAAFLTGAGFSLVVSPCCTPLIGVVVAYAGAMGGVAVSGTFAGVLRLRATHRRCSRR